MRHKIGGRAVGRYGAEEAGGSVVRSREVACDESGSDGENLTGGNTEVFAHASVALPVDAAAECVREIRRRIRSPAEEYKANHLLREKHRAVLEWLLDETGPIHGYAHVELTEKAYLVVERTVALLLGDAAEAGPLYRHGPGASGGRQWREFLRAANRLLRVRSDGDPLTVVEHFFRTVDTLTRARPGPEAARVLRRLSAARPRAVAYRERVRAAPPLFPALNPLFPAIRRTARWWSAGGVPVTLVHDQQNALTPGRVAALVQGARRDGIALDGLRLVDSRDDARVQIADFLAGVARSIAADRLAGGGDPSLIAALRPYTGDWAPAGAVPEWGGPAARGNSGD
ncbi:DUF3800 domain-containing protein [Streptomyces sp. AM6-12]|uniref:DUF3800 domain-containing protein n=1 Tax=Streptomyces sp. AM6-12 TaxID=3345149 RepID=UPI00378A19BA